MHRIGKRLVETAMVCFCLVRVSTFVSTRVTDLFTSNHFIHSFMHLIKHFGLVSAIIHKMLQFMIKHLFYLCFHMLELL